MNLDDMQHATLKHLNRIATAREKTAENNTEIRRALAG